MAYEIVKTEHNGAKHGQGAWMPKADAKHQSNKQRRLYDKRLSGVSARRLFDRSIAKGHEEE